MLQGKSSKSEEKGKPSEDSDQISEPESDIDSEGLDDDLDKIIGQAKSREEAEKNAGKTFDKLDKNKDGSLSIDEILGMVEASEIDDQTRTEAEGLLESLDMDKNGKVDKKEWQTTFGGIYDMMHKKDKKEDKPDKKEKPEKKPEEKKPAEPAPKPEKKPEDKPEKKPEDKPEKKPEKKPDVDDHAEALDGMIESKDEAADDDHPDEELQKIIGDAKNRKEAEKNAGDTFDRLDKNKDGNLSVDEILALVDKSDITDEIKGEA